MRNKHCQLTENIPKYTLVKKNQNRRKSLLHVRVVFSKSLTFDSFRQNTSHFCIIALGEVVIGTKTFIGVE